MNNERAELNEAERVHIIGVIRNHCSDRLADHVAALLAADAQPPRVTPEMLDALRNDIATLRDIQMHSDERAVRLGLAADAQAGGEVVAPNDDIAAELWRLYMLAGKISGSALLAGEKCPASDKAALYEIACQVLNGLGGVYSDLTGIWPNLEAPHKATHPQPQAVALTDQQKFDLFSKLPDDCVKWTNLDFYFQGAEDAEAAHHIGKPKDVGINGLTEAETAASASVMGLTNKNA